MPLNQQLQETRLNDLKKEKKKLTETGKTYTSFECILTGTFQSQIYLFCTQYELFPQGFYTSGFGLNKGTA